MAFVRHPTVSGLLFVRVQRNINYYNPTILLSTLASSGKDEDFKSLSDIPGPVSLPVVGTVWRFFVGGRGEPFGKRLLSSQKESVNKYGPIFKERFSGNIAVSLADPSDVAKVLRNESKYPQRLRLPVFDYYREMRRRIPGVFFADGPEWYKHRSVLSKKMLRPKQVADYASGFNNIITDFIHRLRIVREPDDSEKANEVSGLDNELFKWSFESVAEMIFDKRFGCLEPQVNKEVQIFIKAVGELLGTAISVGYLPVWFYKIYETGQFKKFCDSFDIIHEYTEMFIQRKITDLEDKARNLPKRDNEKVGFFEFLLSSGKLTKDDLLASVIDVLFGGVDTTSNTMQWILYMMAKNPDKQEILRQEVLSVLGNNTTATPTTLAEMPYLKAWVRETLRLYPVFSVMFRVLPTDINLSGYHIPAGTQVNCLAYFMSRDQNIFTDAQEFKPERWLRDNNQNSKFIDAKEVFSSIPFGIGTRMCLGRRIAELELHLLLARIVQQFEIRYPPDAEDVEPFVRGLTIPDRPVTVKFVDRKE